MVFRFVLHSETEKLTFLFYCMLVFIALDVRYSLKEVNKKTLTYTPCCTLQEVKQLLLRLKQTIFHPTRDDSFVPSQNDKILIHISVVHAAAGYLYHSNIQK